MRTIKNIGMGISRGTTAQLRWVLAVAAMAGMGHVWAEQPETPVFVGPLINADHAEPSPAPVRLRSKAAMALPGAGKRIDLGAYSGVKSVAALPDGRLRIGVARDMADTIDTRITASQLQWTVLGTGAKLARFTVQSGGAKGLRLGVLIEQLPATAILRVYAEGDSMAYEASGGEVRALLSQNKAAGDGTPAGQTYWTPVIEAEIAVFEIELPAPEDSDQVRIAIPSLSHLLAAPSATTIKAAGIGASNSCEVDVTCSSDFSAESNALARMQFVDGGATYLCSGTLLNDAASSSTPYFLSANHCISTQTVASTLQTNWFYRASSCNSGTLSPASSVLTGGATLLYASSATDTSFMRLNSSPPSGVTYVGWTTSTPALNQTVTGLHHPAADLQKISRGTLQGFANCVLLSDNIYCTSGTSSSNFIYNTWSSGTTEGGSSGSGLFITNGRSKYLIGQLLGGNTSCPVSTGLDIYGRFDRAYSTALKQWLNPNNAPLLVNAPVSRRASSAGGTWDLPIDTSQNISSKNITIEPRQSETNGINRVVFKFDRPISSATAAISGMPGSIYPAPTSSALQFDTAANEATVPVVGVAQGQRVLVTLTNLNGIANTKVAAPVAYLVGDVTRDGLVNSADTAAQSTRISQITSASNYFYETDHNGVINSGDTALASRLSSSIMEGARP